MTEEEKNELGKKIGTLIEEVRANIAYLTDESKPIPPSVALGRLTRMEAINEKGVNEAMLASERIRLTRLENAMERLTSGNYGLCVRCKKEIPIQRLKAVPEALICVPCADKKKK